MRTLLDTLLFSLKASKVSLKNSSWGSLRSYSRLLLVMVALGDMTVSVCYLSFPSLYSSAALLFSFPSLLRVKPISKVCPALL